MCNMQEKHERKSIIVIPVFEGRTVESSARSGFPHTPETADSRGIIFALDQIIQAVPGLSSKR